MSPPTPPAVGTLAVSGTRCRKAEQPSQAFDGANIASALNGECAVVVGGRVRVRQQVTCNTADCGDQTFVPYACDGTCGTEANWYAVGNEFVGRQLAYAFDSQLQNLAATTRQLSSCTTFAAGAMRKAAQTSFPPRTMATNTCTEDEEAVRLSPSLAAGEVVRVCLRKGDGTALSNCSPSDHTAAATLRAVQPVGGR